MANHCETCDGTGGVCGVCPGDLALECANPAHVARVQCPECNGAGEIDEEPEEASCQKP
jgi:hypothetical protein